MNTSKLQAGQAFPSLVATNLARQSRDLSQASNGLDWMMIVVYRGRHCPLCTRYLNELEGFREKLAQIGVDLAAVSADSAEQLRQHRTELELNFPLYWGLTLAQMQSLGLYISNPRSNQETDHPFAEPGVFVVNEQGGLHVADISNNPFVRPNIAILVSGLKWIRDPQNNYPIRGMRPYE